jgi:hypothetical protein
MNDYLNMKVETIWYWKTHQPMIHLMMNLLQPNLVVELGMGENSTPVFLSYDPENLICVENDAAWIDRIKSQCAFRPKDQVIFHDLKNPAIIFNTTNVSPVEKTRGQIYYYNFKNRYLKDRKERQLLFVDNFACLRMIAIDSLWKEFDVIIYHDCEAEGIRMYSYDFKEMLSNGYEQYILKAPVAWTGCLIRSSLGYTEEQLKKIIKPFITAFCKKNEISEMYLEKQL